MRINFDFGDDPASLRALKLNMRYDDGFVAYLNGTEVARSESVTNATPGSARASSHEAYDFESFDISAFANLLQRGQNVLAIHGINTSTGSTDFLILPELVAESLDEQPANLPIYFTTDGTDPRLAGGGINLAASRYLAPITIDAETTIKARTLQGSIWSGIETRTYLLDVVPADASNLRIDEVHFNPAVADPAAGELDVDNDEFEFIELVNIGEQSINLDNVRFIEVDVNGSAEGVEFSFPLQSLAPGERLVVVENQVAFVSRYGNDIRVAGQYTGRLADGGERIMLLAADGSVIQSFKYDDDVNWPALPDGLGASLQVNSHDGDYSSANNWRASAVAGGTPGKRAFQPGDSNLDGVFNSSDFVQIFTRGKYESPAAERASWADGDWNGDGKFDTRDLVFAFQHGSYSAALVPILNSALLDDITNVTKKRFTIRSSRM
jgi:hypothetical protein